MSPPERSDVDELRARLRALGYLDARVSRFVLGPARETRSVTAIAIRTSLRIGLLAALLLGPAAAIGTALRLPGLITGPQDAVVVAIYLGLLFGGSVAVTACFVAVLAGQFVREIGVGRSFARLARRAATAAGVFVAVASLIYLTLWWRTTDVASGWTSPAWTTFALVVAVAISLLLGDAVTVAALALIARNAGTAELEPRRPRHSWKLSAALGATAFVGAAALLLATPEPSGMGPATVEDHGALTVVPTGARVTLVAIDGFDGALYERLARDGRVSNLRSIMDAAHARLRAVADPDPVRVWTSVATGQPAAVHGLEGLETRRVTGVHGTVPSARSRLAATVAAATDLLRLTRPGLSTGAERRAKTFWEVAAETGLQVAVINWWATWPAPADAGVVITDRALLRLDRGGTLEGEIAPPELYAAVRKSWPSLRQRARARAALTFSGEGQVASVLRRSAELDALVLELAAVSGVGERDLLVLYLPGLDIAQHALLGESTVAGQPVSALAERVDALTRYYDYLDGLLEPVIGPGHANDLVALVTHPGRIAATGQAMLALRGTYVQPGVAVQGSLADVAPTILHALGLPVSQELPGKALLGLFTPAFVARYPPREVDSYGRHPSRGGLRGGSGLDEEMIDRLRSLGYVR